HDRVSEDRDRQEQVDRDAPQNRELLVVLLSEDRSRWTDDTEEFRHHRRDALEVTWAKWPAQMLRESTDANARLFARRIHRRGIRREDDVDVELGDVALEIARVLGEIFVRTELGRVHEDRTDDEVGPRARFADEREMTGMEGAHRG